MVKIAPHAVYPLHYHPDKMEFIYVLEGNPEFKIGSTHFTGQSNDFFIFPANEKHAIENISENETILLVGAIKN